jgi:uncharacterized protein YdaU (DUF1376 family)
LSTQPFLPLFFGDLLAATPTWEGEERALYVLLLAYQWTAGPLPTDPKRIAKMCQYDTKTFTKLWVVVGRKFSETDAGLLNERLEQHRERSKAIGEIRSEFGKLGGKASGEARRKAKALRLLQEDGSRNEPNASDLLKQNRTIHPILSQSEESKSGEDPRKKIFDLGKSILGPDAGSLIARALRSSDEATVGRVLGEMALSTKADPRSYFVAATKPKQRGLVV